MNNDTKQHFKYDDIVHIMDMKYFHVKPNLDGNTKRKSLTCILSAMWSAKILSVKMPSAKQQKSLRY